MTSIPADTGVDRGRPDGGGPDAATAVYHVNDREGRVSPHGEDLQGREILSRAGFSTDKYELFEIVNGKTGPEIPAETIHPVKPGDQFRATIRGTDYSSARA